MNYEEIVCDANNLYRAYKVSVKSSKWKESTQKFMMNFLRYIFEIQDDIINRTLQNGPTQEFELHERGRIRSPSILETSFHKSLGFIIRIPLTIMLSMCVSRNFMEGIWMIGTS